MFYPVYVCLSATSRKYCWLYLREKFTRDLSVGKEELSKFRKLSGCGVRIPTPDRLRTLEQDRTVLGRGLRCLLMLWLLILSNYFLVCCKCLWNKPAELACHRPASIIIRLYTAVYHAEHLMGHWSACSQTANCSCTATLSLYIYRWSSDTVDTGIHSSSPLSLGWPGVLSGPVPSSCTVYVWPSASSLRQVRAANWTR